MSQEVTITNWLEVARLAGKYGIRFPTNSRLEEFLSEIEPYSKNADECSLRDALTDAVALLEQHYSKPARNGEIARARAALAKVSAA